ncbi:MAG: glycosyltransferase family 87 protein [Kiloniellales bacterium]|nr:glycosyltransferase family 87 protein [Kiloniellales bacterium]
MPLGGYWLDKRRLMVYSRLFVAVYALGLVAWLIARVWLADTPVATLRNDFAALWSVGHMVLQGRASEAYVPEQALAAEAELVPEHEVRLPWFYPPPVFALIAPLATLPFLPAFFLWSGGGLAGLAWSVRALAPSTPAVWLLLASPGLFWILRFGQTGVLAAALLGGALYLMARRRPLSAGLLIGLLTFKPHLGLLVPFALFAGKEWRVFAAATVTTLALAAASTLAFGAEVWPRFFEAMDIASAMQSRGALPHNQLVSLYAGLRTLGLANGHALALQALLGFAVLALTVRVWHAMGACLLSGALLAAGSLLAAPHVLGYDLALAAPALAILAADGWRRGWLPGEREGYMLLWLWPLCSGVIAELTRFPVGVAGSLLLFALAYRRCRVLGPEETG